jgi:hypothetical protein
MGGSETAPAAARTLGDARLVPTSDAWMLGHGWIGLRLSSEVDSSLSVLCPPAPCLEWSIGKQPRSVKVPGVQRVSV